jgi:hypothetical protein
MKDLTGLVFYDLTVVRYAGKQNHNGKIRNIWECKCICGKTCIACTGQLSKEGKKSCGCRKVKSRIQNGKNNYKGKEHSGLTHVLNSYRQRAKKIGVVFSLTRNEVKELITNSCVYCGTENSNLLRRSAYVYEHNGIDRLDVTQGYTLSNTVSCCKNCNYMKLQLSVEDFLLHVKKIAQFNNL